MPSADQVPVITPHSTMRWHIWVVLIAGSTGSALRAVRPPNLHITPVIGAISVTWRARRVPCSAHPLPSWPKPFARSCEPHVCPGNGFADRLGVSGIILVSLHVRLDIGRRHQAHGVAECLEFARPMMR